MKLCADCRHIVTDQPEAVMCGRTKMTNTVTGEPFWTKCVDERKDSWRKRFFHANCGTTGRFWEAKVGEVSRPRGTPPEFRWGTPPGGTEDRKTYDGDD